MGKGKRLKNKEKGISRQKTEIQRITQEVLQDVLEKGLRGLIRSDQKVIIRVKTL